MPHIHLLLILKDDEVCTPDDVDKYVCARIPPLPAADDESPEAHQQRRLWHIVTSCMLHDCNAACLVERKDGRGYKCKKHFPKPFSEFTKLSCKSSSLISYFDCIIQLNGMLNTFEYHQ
jgi:hypothetical protein